MKCNGRNKKAISYVSREKKRKKKCYLPTPKSQNFSKKSQKEPKRAKKSLLSEEEQSIGISQPSGIGKRPIHFLNFYILNEM